MKKVLITGASSYLGRSLREYLEGFPEEYQVEALSLRGDTWKHFDFTGFDCIYHTAALVHHKETKDDPAFLYIAKEVLGDDGKAGPHQT